MPKKIGVFSYATFNLSALLNLAGQFRNIPCSCDPAQEPKSGSLNWVIFLSFEDGVQWTFRSPRACYDISPETTAELLKSEVATMKYIRLNSSIPVPEVFDYSHTESNPIGIPFILMSKASGFPLSTFSWNAYPEGMVVSRKPPPGLKRSSKEKIMEQLGAISSQLLNLRFDKIGSLFQEKGEYRIYKCLSPALLWHGRDCLGDDTPRGPFEHDHDYYESLLSAFLLHIKELPLEQHTFFAPIPVLTEFETLLKYRSAVDRWNDFVTVGSKIDSSKNRLDYCIAGDFLGKMIPLISQRSLTVPGNKELGFPLYHPDLSTSNIFVDDDFNITCIIDWAFSSTVPISTLLMTPSFPHPRDDVDTTLVPIFRAGFTQHYYQSQDITLDPKFWDSTQRAWLFTRLVTLDGLQDHRYFTELYISVHKSEDELNIPKLFKDVQKKEEFVELAKALAADDRSASEVEKDEKEYFFYSKSGQEAIARKLTMVEGLSEGFVADKRLWQWIKEAMA